MNYPFEKWHGLGNDFAVVTDPAAHGWWAERVEALCDRHRGIGADGVLLVDPDAPSMRVLNADGSEPEMCGNGIRCVAAALAERGGGDRATLDVRTGAGVLRCVATRTDGDTWQVRVTSGTPSFVARDAGVDSDDTDLWLDAPPVPGAPDGAQLRGIVGSVGNPHWIFFEHPGAASLSLLGPALEHDPRFRNRTNVEFVTGLGEDAWRVDVWERGVGITQACGTGATTVAAALVRTGRAAADRPLRIELPGGPLTITIEPSGAATVEGPAQRVFTGEVATR